MNKNKLTSKIHKISREKDVAFNILLQLYFFESFLERLAQSDYQKKFILKGGFLLSSILGIHQRSTLDMDFILQDIIFSYCNRSSSVKLFLFCSFTNGFLGFTLFAKPSIPCSS